MEFPRRLTLVERLLAAALLAAAVGTAWLEARSPAAEAARAGRPLTAWVALESPMVEVPRLYLLFLSAGNGAADLIYLPETTVVAGKNTTLAKVYGVSRRQGAARRDASKAMADAAQALLEPSLPPGARPAYFYYDGGADDGSDPGLWGRRWLADRTQGYGLWREVGLQLAGRRRGFGLDGFEKLRLGVELHLLRDDKLRAAYLPEQKELTQYFAGLAGAVPVAEPREASVEVLNASSRPGAAAGLTKRLRAHGIDVLSTGNASAKSFSIVYDRTGRPEFAEKVRRLLDCPTAETMTVVDRTRVVDASVVLGEDCSGQ